MVGMPFSSTVAQTPEGCLADGMQFPANYYLPNLWNGYVIVSDERRTADQLPATFADPADALARLDAWCWSRQAERVYVKDDLTVDVSIHDFLESAGATVEFEGVALAQKWFGEQRAHDLGLTRDDKTRAELEEDLGPVNIEALDNIDIDAYSNHRTYAVRTNSYGDEHPEREPRTKRPRRSCQSFWRISGQRQEPRICGLPSPGANLWRGPLQLSKLDSVRNV
jgi:hypothetical protein